MNDKENSEELSREQVKAQREAKKAAKLAAKSKAKEKLTVNCVPSNSAQQDDKVKNLQPAQVEKKVQNVKLEQPSKENIKLDPKKNQDQTKSKSQLKAERNAIQEKQRQAKAAALAEKIKQLNLNKSKPEESKTAKPSKDQKTLTKEVLQSKDTNITSPRKNDTENGKTTTLVHKVKLFNHLYRDNLSVTSSSDIHPAIYRLGVQYATGVVRGSNARCVALLKALIHMICEHVTPSEKEYARGFEEQLAPAMHYLNKCRPHSVSMMNALKHFKSHLTQLPNDITDTQARLKLKETIDTYIHEQVDMAGDAICMYIQKKITNGDVILTYGCSSLVEKIMLTAHSNGKKFRVIVIDGSPWYEGKEMVRRLVQHNIECTYVLLYATSFIMREVTKVIVGAHALLSNGAVMSRAGTAHVALVAQAFNVPVLAACETHKFCERVQTDALVFNELGDPDELISEKSPAKNWKNLPRLTPLSLIYDITPSHLVTAVITELAIVPCTSVPVVLRVKPAEII